MNVHTDLRGPTTGARACPTCGAQTGGKEVASSRPRAEDVDDQTRAEHWRGFRPDKVFFSYLRCAKCRQVYSSSYFSEVSLQGLYHTMADNSAGEDPVTLARTQAGYVRVLQGVASPSGRWLDIGADIGLLASALRGVPGVEEVDGVEPNTAVHSELRARLGSEGEISESVASVGHRYDGVAAIHVVDHLLLPMAELTRWRDVLNDEGLLLLVVHSEASVLRRLLRRKWPPYCLQHPQLYSPQSMRSLLDRVGFDVLRVRRTSNYFSVDQVLAVGLAVVGIKYARRDRLRSVVLPLRLGNIAIIAKKRPGV
jgi:hypothetical protein